MRWLILSVLVGCSFEGGGGEGARADVEDVARALARSSDTAALAGAGAASEQAGAPSATVAGSGALEAPALPEPLPPAEPAPAPEATVDAGMAGSGAPVPPDVPEPVVEPAPVVVAPHADGCPLRHRCVSLSAAGFAGSVCLPEELGGEVESCSDVCADLVVDGFAYTRKCGVPGAETAWCAVPCSSGVVDFMLTVVWLAR